MEERRENENGIGEITVELEESNTLVCDSVDSGEKVISKKKKLM